MTEPPTRPDANRTKGGHSTGNASRVEAVSGDRPVASAIALALSMMVSLSACSGRDVSPAPAPVARATPAPRTIADQFITTFWCGPPLNFFDDDRAKEIADAGFNLVGASCEGPVTPRLNKRALRIAGRHGLEMLIKDSRVSAASPLSSEWQAKANQAIATYRKHDNLAGFFLVDEPNDPATYPDIAALRRRIRSEAPGLIGYVNLLPDYVFQGPEDYREYVEAYTFETRPDLLSYDHYPFLEGSDRPSFFDNLVVFREISREYRVPFLLIVQLMPHADYRDVNDAELSWQVFHAIAFGARGISYFAYWTPSQVPDNLAYRFRKGVIEGGLQTEHYGRVANLNRRIHAIAAELNGYESVGVWDTRAEFGDPHRPGIIGGIESGEIVVGEFARSDGSRAAFLVNRDYRTAAEVTVRPTGPGPLQVFDAIKGSWSVLTTVLRLPPGEGRLIRSAPASPR